MLSARVQRQRELDERLEASRRREEEQPLCERAPATLSKLLYMTCPGAAKQKMFKEPIPKSPAKTAEAATQTPPPPSGKEGSSNSDIITSGNINTGNSNSAATTSGNTEDSSLQTDPPLAPSTPLASLVRAQAVVMHGVLTRYKPGQVRRWIEEDNEGVEVMGIR
ncbi:hypothetical protein EV426DRAFT_711779 [Tirmania nivea]|nr:hypothetical protein EV426DRAFT_711779 [Tirmania nivea]